MIFDFEMQSLGISILHDPGFFVSEGITKSYDPKTGL